MLISRVGLFVPICYAHNLPLFLHCLWTFLSQPFFYIITSHIFIYTTLAKITVLQLFFLNTKGYILMFIFLISIYTNNTNIYFNHFLLVQGNLHSRTCFVSTYIKFCLTTFRLLGAFVEVRCHIVLLLADVFIVIIVVLSSWL